VNPLGTRIDTQGMRPARPLLAVAAMLVVAGCADPAPPPVVPDVTDKPATTTTRSAVDPSAAADAATFGTWRRAPVAPSGQVAAASEAACRTLAEVGDLPLRVTDNRGGARLTLLFTDRDAAVVCQVEVARSGDATADARALPELVTAPAPTEATTLGARDIQLIEDAGEARLVLVGRAADVPTVEVSFDDATWARTSLAGGWYTIWWPQAALALTVASVDRRSVVIDSYPVK
jgi:hypothetical protein